MVDYESLARQLADIDDPLTYSSEGLDDGCFFCGARPTCDRLPVGGAS